MKAVLISPSIRTDDQEKRMPETDNLVEVKLILTRDLADQLRQPEGVTHDGPVVLRLHDDDTLTVKFLSPAARDMLEEAT